MRTVSSSPKGSRRPGCASRQIEQRAKRRAELEADRKRYSGRGRYYPNKTHNQLQFWIPMGVGGAVRIAGKRGSRS
jgi:hypothetical protein